MTEPFQFLRPAALLLAPVVVVLWWLWQRHADPLRGWRAQMDPEILGALVDRSSAGRGRAWPFLAAWLFGVLAIAGPSWRPEPSPFAEDATPLVILLKADLSMETPDPEPSRMERAHLKIRDLSEARKGQPLGLIAYASSAHLVLPPTKDTSAVATMAAEISPEIMPEPGDRLDLAIARAARLLENQTGSLLIITDTASAATEALAEAWKKAGSPDIQILAISPPAASVEPLEPMAKSLRAPLVPMSTDDADIADIVRHAARTPVARDAKGNARRKDDGYLLVPVIAVLALLPFRRETRTLSES
ncbi:VWA domain-containing protein [Haloferula sp. A504]|uniref:vWA domain-containing protein n=1 Tax=Haloferula sp. A504 TaxID=3373601 RepID=UPI0031C91263|nr:VWA domain-containing protein [Verrucomicrobiaceae bacterium E54]